jgi:hypothetical protein
MEEGRSLPGGYGTVGRVKCGCFFVIRLCGTEEGTWQIASKEFADAAVFENGFLGGTSGVTRRTRLRRSRVSAVDELELERCVTD